jgi:hypothetical protein
MFYKNRRTNSSVRRAHLEKKRKQKLLIILLVTVTLVCVGIGMFTYVIRRSMDEYAEYDDKTTKSTSGSAKKSGKNSKSGDKDSHSNKVGPHTHDASASSNQPFMGGQPQGAKPGQQLVPQMQQDPPRYGQQGPQPHGAQDTPSGDPLGAPNKPPIRPPPPPFAPQGRIPGSSHPPNEGLPPALQLPGSSYPPKEGLPPALQLPANAAAESPQTTPLEEAPPEPQPAYSAPYPTDTGGAREVRYPSQTGLQETLQELGPPPKGPPSNILLPPRQSPSTDTSL